MPTRSTPRATIRGVFGDLRDRLARLAPLNLLAALNLLAPPLCWSCGAPAPRGDPVCRACRRSLRFLPRAPVAVAGLAVWAPLAYDGPAVQLVKALKFHAAARLADVMGALMVANAPARLLAGHLVPVPLHPARRRSRPFNQAALIARAIAGRTGLPLADCLVRTGPDRRQVGRGRTERLTASGSVEAIERPPSHVVLVDDVVTTGATLSACASALRAAGAERVAAVAFARTVGR